jgi:anti-sigma factor RsiW
MQTEHITESVEAYALGALDEAERAHVERHIKDCPACRRRLNKAEETAHMLAFVPQPVEPPIRCKRKVLARVEQDALLSKPIRGSRFRPSLPVWSGLAAMLLVMVLGAGWTIRLQREVERLRAENTQQQAEMNQMRTSVAQFNMMDSILANAEAMRELHGEGPAESAVARTYMKPGDNRAVLEVHNLPPLPEGKVYQVWVARPNLQEPLTAFRVAGSFERYMIEPPEPMDTYNWIMVTVEDAGNSSQPSETIVLAGDL